MRYGLSLLHIFVKIGNSEKERVRVMSESNKNFIKQGSILAMAGILVRLIGMLYRIPLANIIGDEGNGIYSVAYNVYNIAMVLSSYGLPMAVSKLVSTELARKRYKNTGRILAMVMCYAVLAGGIAASVIFFGADFLAENVYTGYAGIERPLRVLAPTVFVVAILGTIRGFFQGHNTMVPTAVSQIIEQIINAAVSIIAAYTLVTANASSPEVASYGAAGSTVGTAVGAVAALAFCGFLFACNWPFFKKKMKADKSGVLQGYGEICQLILYTTIPIVLGQTFHQISAVFDDILFGKVMMVRQMEASVISASSGVYNSIYILLIGIPMGIASSMASSTLPSIAQSKAQGFRIEVKEKIAAAIRFNMMIAIPSAVGLAVLGEQVARMLFPRLDYVTGGLMLRYGSAAVVFFALSTITGSILQAVNRMVKPVVHSCISLLIHLVLVTVLMLRTNLGIYSLVVGYVTFPLVISILNLLTLRTELRYRQEMIHTFLIPLGCALFMGLMSLLTYHGIFLVSKSNTISLIVAVVVALVAYFGSMHKSGNLRKM